jgi:NADH:ubiquinone oxidoreductase subunit 6 (subunit J)
MKRVLVGAVVCFILFQLMSLVVDQWYLASEYEAAKSVWRPDMDRLMWVYFVLSAVGSFFFAFIFSKGYEGKGSIEGVRYGFYIGVWMSMGMAYGTYAMIAIPYSLAVKWFLTGILQYMIAGWVLAIVFARLAPKSTA